jgi:hypothetical protein
MKTQIRKPSHGRTQYTSGNPSTGSGPGICNFKDFGARHAPAGTPLPCVVATLRMARSPSVSHPPCHARRGKGGITESRARPFLLALFSIFEEPEPIVSSHARINPVGVPPTYLYDFDTVPGDEYAFTAKGN